MAEVTKPVFIDGKPYGYSCASKFAKVQKPTKKIVQLNYGFIDEFNETRKTVRKIEMADGSKTRATLVLNESGQWTAMRSKNNFTMIENILYYEL